MNNCGMNIKPKYCIKCGGALKLDDKLKSDSWTFYLSCSSCDSVCEVVIGDHSQFKYYISWN